MKNKYCTHVVLCEVLPNQYSEVAFTSYNKAWEYFNKVNLPVKVLYKVLDKHARELGPLTIHGATLFDAKCPVFKMEQYFAKSPHNKKFVVI